MPNNEKSTERNNAKSVAVTDDFFSSVTGDSDGKVVVDDLFEVEDEPTAKPNAKPEGEGSIGELKSKISTLEEELVKAKGGYSGSTKEVQRLQSKIEDLENVVQGKLAAAQPKSVYEALGIDKENFVMDVDEALRDGNSDSGKVLGAYVGSMINTGIKNALGQIAESSTKNEKVETFKREKAELMKQNNWTDEQFNDWFENARNVPASLQNLFLITNSQDVISRAAQNKNNMNAAQRNSIKSLPDLFGQSGSPGKININDAIFNAISRGDSDIDLNSL